MISRGALTPLVVSLYIRTMYGLLFLLRKRLLSSSWHILVFLFHIVMRNLGNIFNEFYDCTGEIFHHMYCNLILTSFNLSTCPFQRFLCSYVHRLLNLQQVSSRHLSKFFTDIFSRMLVFKVFVFLHMRVSNIEL